MAGALPPARPGAGGPDPETLALPLAAGKRSLLVETAGALVRTGPRDGFFLEAASLELLPLLPGIAERPDFTLYQHDAAPEPPAAVVELVAHRQQVEEPTTLLAEGLDERRAINLLQGEYGPQAGWERHWYRWRWPAALLLLLLLLQAGLGWWENRQLRHHEQQLAAAIEEVYRQTFPDSRRVVNARVQMEQRLQELGGGSDDGDRRRDFLELLGAGGETLAAADLQLRGLRYRDGGLDLELEIASLQALDRLEEELTAAGLGVEIRSATSRGERVQARLQLQSSRR
ncbi:MAG: type II secretion system protein GspL [Desulfurivibrio sp.]|nr:type II secretion system protein GspL [Desulfurivibrio sp.]